MESATKKDAYLVSNQFVEKIFDENCNRQDRHKDAIMREIAQMEEKVTNVMNIKLEDMPRLEDKFDLQ